MALTLTIGAAQISLTQTSAPTQLVGGGLSMTLTLPTASQAGATLIAILAGSQVSAATIASGPVGWVLLKAQTQAAGPVDLEVWAYPNNPGGITSAAFAFSQAQTGGAWHGLISEWADVYSVGAMEASGTATATSGTTLAPTTSSNVLTAGDLAIATWIQISVGACTFTTPGGWSRLGDDGAAAVSGHLDAEYLINPTTGVPLGPTLTSTQTTTSAAGIIVVLKPAPPVADQTAYLEYGTLSLTLNTLDFSLIDCPTPIQNSMQVTLSSPGDFPDWTGQVAQVRAADVVDLRTGHNRQTITATNTDLPNFTSAPFNLSDNPAADSNDVWLLENGDTWGLENGSGDWLMESSIQEAGYASLSIGTQFGQTQPYKTLVTLGYARIYRPGLWPGMTFQLTSSNLALWLLTSGGLYTIQTITITYQGAGPPSPVYDLQFGDRILTLAEWAAANA